MKICSHLLTVCGEYFIFLLSQLSREWKDHFLWNNWKLISVPIWKWPKQSSRVLLASNKHSSRFSDANPTLTLAESVSHSFTVIIAPTSPQRWSCQLLNGPLSPGWPENLHRKTGLGQGRADRHHASLPHRTGKLLLGDWELPKTCLYWYPVLGAAPGLAVSAPGIEAQSLPRASGDSSSPVSQTSTGWLWQSLFFAPHATHTSPFSDTCWMSCNSVPSLCCQPEHSPASHRWQGSPRSCCESRLRRFPALLTKQLLIGDPWPWPWGP